MARQHVNRDQRIILQTRENARPAPVVQQVVRPRRSNRPKKTVYVQAPDRTQILTQRQIYWLAKFFGWFAAFAAGNQYWHHEYVYSGVFAALTFAFFCLAGVTKPEE